MRLGPTSLLAFSSRVHDRGRLGRGQLRRDGNTRANGNLCVRTRRNHKRVGRRFGDVALNSCLAPEPVPI